MNDVGEVIFGLLCFVGLLYLIAAIAQKIAKIRGSDADHWMVVLCFVIFGGGLLGLFLLDSCH